MDFNFTIDEHGIFYPESGRVLINPARHESIAELINTINHETIHMVLEECDLDEVAEHWAIKKIQWIDEFL